MVPEEVAIAFQLVRLRDKHMAACRCLRLGMCSSARLRLEVRLEGEASQLGALTRRKVKACSSKPRLPI